MKDFRLLMYCRWWISSATTTVNNCDIPARSESAWSVFSFVVFRLATQKLSLKWLIDFSTFTRILQVPSHSCEPRSTPGYALSFFRDKHKSFCHRKRLCRDYRNDKRVDLTCIRGCIPIWFWNIRISWLEDYFLILIKDVKNIVLGKFYKDREELENYISANNIIKSNCDINLYQNIQNVAEIMT